MRCDAHVLALALDLGLCCSLCLVPLREVPQVKLKPLAWAIAVAAAGGWTACHASEIYQHRGGAVR